MFFSVSLCLPVSLSPSSCPINFASSFFTTNCKACCYFCDLEAHKIEEQNGSCMQIRKNAESAGTFRASVKGMHAVKVHL